MYGWCANIAANYLEAIPGVTEEEAERIHRLFNARWLYFHTTVFTAAMFLDSEFINDKHTKKEEDEFREVLELLAATPDCPFTEDEMVTEWSYMKTALLTKSSGLNDKAAFTVRACKMAPFEARPSSKVRKTWLSQFVSRTEEGCFVISARLVLETRQLKEKRILFFLVADCLW